MKSEKIYNDKFYEKRNNDTKYAAKCVVEIISKQFSCNSVIDFGCGVGTWLATFKRAGATEVLGIDGEYVNRKHLVIDSAEFEARDLNSNLEVNKRYDLAMSLEVAEHLPSTKAAYFVKALCLSSDLVLFSAAAAKQGGDGHVNERRLSYWIQLFKKEGYQVFDIIRPAIWHDKKIPVWYRNNVVIFAKKGTDKIAKLESYDIPKIYDMINPDLYESKINQYEKLMERLPIKGINYLYDLIKKR